MPDDDDVAPAHLVVLSKDDDAMRGAADRVAQIGVAAAFAVPVFAEMSVVPESARDVKAFCVVASHGALKAIGQADGRSLSCRDRNALDSGGVEGKKGESRQARV